MARKTRRMSLGVAYRTAEVLLRPAMMGITKRDWQGTEHLLAHGQGIVVGVNHLSWFDPLVIAHFLHDNGRPPRFMAKQAVFDVPVIGSILSGAGQIPVIRDADPTHALAAAINAVRAGECLVMYPEGTITRDPGLWPMTGKTGALRVALETGAPLVPVAQWGAQEVLAPYTKRAHVLPRKVMRVRAGTPVQIDDLRGMPRDRDVLDEGTNRLMDAIAALLAQIRGETSPTERLDWAAEKQRRADMANNEED